MFVHKERLVHLLQPVHYFDDQLYRQEINRLFLPAWHRVGTRPHLPRPGDRVTLDLFGRRVSLSNCAGEVRPDPPGWPCSLEPCGDLLFLSFADDPPPLRDYLAPWFGRMAASFAPPFQPAWTWEKPLPCNWKVPVENTLEAYHVPCLHRKTLDMYPPEEAVSHVLNEKWSTLRTRGIQGTRHAHSELDRAPAGCRPATWPGCWAWWRFAWCGRSSWKICRSSGRCSEESSPAFTPA